MITDPALGAISSPDGTRFAVWSHDATQLWLCLFDDADRETARLPMARDGDVHAVDAPGVGVDQRYGLRAEGPYDPSAGLWFDPAKLLLDPYASRIDRPFAYDVALGGVSARGHDTAALVPKGVVEAPAAAVPRAAPRYDPAGLIYEVNVRSFTRLHPEVAVADRGTLRALAHPAVIAHLTRLGVSAVELMPIAAWIDERHLVALGLRNAWGYNPVSFVAPDPRLAPGGIADLRLAVEALHAAGIGVILDVVFNHTGESDALGPTLSLRGLDACAYFRHGPGGILVNDAGTGNTVNCQHAATRALILHAMRRFVEVAGVDGFRFDLATVLGRTDTGFDPDAPLLAALRADPVLADRVMIAEPWDIGVGGYQLGGFRPPMLEWNDRYRDDVRRFWRGDHAMLGALATRLVGSPDLFGPGPTRSLSFVAAHDGLTLADVAAFADRHNEANGENNRDGHGDNLSWNNGIEGPTDSADVLDARTHDVRALIGTLFATRGPIMLTAGDEFGRTQGGNNNAYAQDNALTWLEWAARDLLLEAHVATISALRRRWPALSEPDPAAVSIAWCGAQGQQHWEPDARFLLMIVTDDGGRRLAVAINGTDEPIAMALPDGRWIGVGGATPNQAPARSVTFFEQG